MVDKAAPVSADDLIAIPSDEIQLGHDQDGLPKVVATETAATGKAIEDEGDDTALRAAQKERDEHKAEAERLAREAATERKARLAAEEDAAGSRHDRDKRTGEAVGAHRAAVREKYGRMASEVEYINSNITQANGMLAQARRDLAAAHTAGEGERVAELTEHIGKITGQLAQFETLKPNVEAALNEAKHNYEQTEQYVAEAARKKIEEPAAVAQPKGPKDFDDFSRNYADDWIDKSPRAAQSWLREHKGDVLKDSTKFEQLNTFARLYALKHGESALNSTKFVRALDGEFFPEQEELEVADTNDEPDEVVEAPKPKAKKIAAAPVGRSNVFSSDNMSAKAVRLPPKLAQFVKESGLDPTKYAHQAVADIKAGKLPKNFLDPDYDHTF